MGMPAPEPNLERLYLIRAELNRVRRSVTILRQQVAREIEEIESATNTNDTPGGDTNERTAEQEQGRVGQA